MPEKLPAMLAQLAGSPVPADVSIVNLDDIKFKLLHWKYNIAGKYYYIMGT